MSDGANDSVGWNEEAVLVQSRVVEAVASSSSSSSSSSLSSEEDVDQVGMHGGRRAMYLRIVNVMDGRNHFCQVTIKRTRALGLPKVYSL